MFLHKTMNKKYDSIAKQIMMRQQNMPGKPWLKKVMEIIEETGFEVTIEEAVRMKKSKWKKMVNEKIWKKEQEEFEE